MGFWNRLALVTPPTAEVIDLDTVKSFLNVHHYDEDDLVQGLISAAVAFVEGPSGIGRALRPQAWRASYDAFPCSFRLEFGPVVSVDGITYVDGSGATQTVSPSLYFVDLDHDPAVVAPVFGYLWPTPQLGRPGAVKVTFTCGYDPVPDDLRHAIMLLVEHWYTNRGAAAGLDRTASPGEIPFGISALLNRHRVVVFG